MRRLDDHSSQRLSAVIRSRMTLESISVMPSSTDRLHHIISAELPLPSSRHVSDHVFPAGSGFRACDQTGDKSSG